MTTEDYIIEAAEIVVAWELPESEIAEAIMVQAHLMAGLEVYDNDQDSQLTH